MSSSASQTPAKSPKLRRIALLGSRAVGRSAHSLAMSSTTLLYSSRRSLLGQNNTNESSEGQGKRLRRTGYRDEKGAHSTEHSAVLSVLKSKCLQPGCLFSQSGELECGRGIKRGVIEWAWTNQRRSGKTSKHSTSCFPLLSLPCPSLPYSSALMPLLQNTSYSSTSPSPFPPLLPCNPLTTEGHSSTPINVCGEWKKKEDMLRLCNAETHIHLFLL